MELGAKCGVVGAQRFDFPRQAFDRFRLRQNKADKRFLIKRIKRLAIHSQLESTRDSAVKLSQRRHIRANSNRARNGAREQLRRRWARSSTTSHPNVSHSCMA